MAQFHVWEREYRKPQLITQFLQPQAFVLRFLKFLKKQHSVDLAEMRILDIGSGTGRNANYLAERCKEVTGIEISTTAITSARAHAKESGVDVNYIQQSMGERYPLNDSSIDIALDVTSSNSLNEAEREVYLIETVRVLRSKGYFFVRALCKDGDSNAKKLLQQFPGKEHDTYIMPEMGLTERVFSREDFIATYSPYFIILHLQKDTTYTKFNNRSYKRNFWIAYLQKKS